MKNFHYNGWSTQLDGSWRGQIKRRREKGLFQKKKVCEYHVNILYIFTEVASIYLSLFS